MKSDRNLDGGPGVITTNEILTSPPQDSLKDHKASIFGSSITLREQFCHTFHKFEQELKGQTAIAEITSFCAYLPHGYNQGSVKVKP